MSEVLEFSHGLNSPAERRTRARQRPNSLTYIELDKENGGIVLDASENGVCVQAVVSLTDDVLPQVRLRLPDSKEWLEFRARVVWTRESRKVAGLQFEELPERGRVQMREWLAREASDAQSEAPPIPEEASAFPCEASNPEIPLVSGAAEIRPAAALALVDYTDQSAQLDAGEVAEVVRGDVPITVASGTVSAARILSVPFSGISIASERANRAEAEGKPLESEPKQPVLRDAAHPRLVERVAWVYVLLLALSVGSVAAGWAVGRGKLAPAIERLRGMLSQQRASAAAIEARPGPAAEGVNEIEVVDVNGQSWKVSLQAPAAGTAALPARSAHAYSSAPDAKPAMNFQIWTLSAPRRSASSGAAASVDAAPPAMPASNGGANTPQIAAISSGDATNGYAAVPKPENFAGVLKRGTLLRRVEPEYPELAKDQRVSGTVVLSAQVGVDGKVRQVRIISGPRLLTAAAADAVRQWRYAPTLLDGNAIETQVQISLVFHLPGESQ